MPRSLRAALLSATLALVLAWLAPVAAQTQPAAAAAVPHDSDARDGGRAAAGDPREDAVRAGRSAREVQGRLRHRSAAAGADCAPRRRRAGRHPVDWQPAARPRRPRAERRADGRGPRAAARGRVGGAELHRAPAHGAQRPVVFTAVEPAPDQHAAGVGHQPRRLPVGHRWPWWTPVRWRRRLPIRSRCGTAPRSQTRPFRSRKARTSARRGSRAPGTLRSGRGRFSTWSATARTWQARFCRRRTTTWAWPASRTTPG